MKYRRGFQNDNRHPQPPFWQLRMPVVMKDISCGLRSKIFLHHTHIVALPIENRHDIIYQSWISLLRIQFAFLLLLRKNMRRDIAKRDKHRIIRVLLLYGGRIYGGFIQ